MWLDYSWVIVTFETSHKSFSWESYVGSCLCSPIIKWNELKVSNGTRRVRFSCHHSKSTNRATIKKWKVWTLKLTESTSKYTIRGPLLYISCTYEHNICMYADIYDSYLYAHIPFHVVVIVVLLAKTQKELTILVIINLSPPTKPTNQNILILRHCLFRLRQHKKEK